MNLAEMARKVDDRVFHIAVGILSIEIDYYVIDNETVNIFWENPPQCGCCEPEYGTNHFPLSYLDMDDSEIILAENRNKSNRRN